MENLQSKYLTLDSLKCIENVPYYEGFPVFLSGGYRLTKITSKGIAVYRLDEDDVVLMCKLHNGSVFLEGDSKIPYELPAIAYYDWTNYQLTKSYPSFTQLIGSIKVATSIDRSYFRAVNQIEDYELPIDLDVVEYPSHEQLFELPINTKYIYVSCTYLNGLINYVSHKKVYLINRYRNLNEFAELVNSLDSKEQYHTNYSTINEELMILGELKDSWVLFDYDPDVSDCCIARISKEEVTYEDMIRYVESEVKRLLLHEYPKKDRPLEFVELPIPKDWVKY